MWNAEPLKDQAGFNRNSNERKCSADSPQPVCTKARVRLLLVSLCSLPRLPLSPFGAACATGRVGREFGSKTWVPQPFQSTFFPQKDVFQWERPIGLDENSLYLPGSSRVRPECLALVDIWGLMTAGGSFMRVSSWKVRTGLPIPTRAPQLLLQFIHPQSCKETQTCPWAQPHLKVKNNTKVLRKVQKKKRKKEVEIKPPPHLKATYPFKKGLNVIYFQRTRDRLRIAGTFSLTQIYIIVLNFSPFLPIILFLSL